MIQCIKFKGFKQIDVNTLKMMLKKFKLNQVVSLTFVFNEVLTKSGPMRTKIYLILEDFKKKSEN